MQSNHISISIPVITVHTSDSHCACDSSITSCFSLASYSCYLTFVSRCLCLSKNIFLSHFSNFNHFHMYPRFQIYLSPTPEQHILILHVILFKKQISEKHNIEINNNTAYIGITILHDANILLHCNCINYSNVCIIIVLPIYDTIMTL